MKPWTDAHAPKSPKEIVGQSEAYERVKRHVEQHKRGRKPILLTGPTGCGKTSLVYVLAHDLDREVVEVNASDTRNKEQIERVLGAAAQQQSLFFRGRIILVDEVDGVSGVKDRGAVTTLVDLAGKSGHPIIFTAQDAEHEKLKPLRKVAEIATLAPPNTEEIAHLLERIARSERVHVEKDSLLAIARRSGGDVRAAINDLQSLGGTITKDDIDLLSDREQEVAIEQALTRVFKTTSAEVALPAFDYVNEEPDKILLWIEENLAREYSKPEDLARALDVLAEADRFFGRIRRWQYYRFYVYMYNLLSAGIALAKSERYRGTIEYRPQGRFLTMWIYGQKNAKRKRLAEQLAPKLHLSVKRTRQDVLPYLKHAWQRDKGFRKELVEAYDLDEDACGWFEK